MTVLTDGGKAWRGRRKGPCARGRPGAGLWRAAQALGLPTQDLGPPGPPVQAWPPHPPAPHSPRRLCRVPLGTFSGTRAGLSPAAPKAHAQSSAPGSASFSQKRGLGSPSEPARGGLWVRDTVRAGTRGTCCWQSPRAVSGGRAQLHPSAASCLLPSGVKFQPWRHRILGWGPERPRPAPPFRAHLAAPPSGIRSPRLH